MRHILLATVAVFGLASAIPAFAAGDAGGEGVKTAQSEGVKVAAADGFRERTAQGEGVKVA
jgi:hypothetical protein